MNLKEYVYINAKVIKFILWEYWFGGSVKVGKDRYLVTGGLLHDGVVEWELFAPIPKLKIMNREAVKNRRRED